MSSLRGLVQVVPSKAYLDQVLAKASQESIGGLFLAPPIYTFDSLLPTLLNQTPLPKGIDDLSPLAGPILVQNLLRNQKDQESLFSGIAKGRKFPAKLWRLLVEIKAAKLGPDDILEMDENHHGRFQALANLYQSYQVALKKLKLADQADRLDLLDQMLEQGLRPPVMDQWDRLVALDVLWLRTLDMRLLSCLAKALDIEVEFCLVPSDDQGPVRLSGLLRTTEKYIIENIGTEKAVIKWHDLSMSGGPLVDLAYRRLGVSKENLAHINISDHLSLIRASGRYPEIEDLVTKAYELVEAGVEPEKIALVAIDIDIQGQMAAYAAHRIGLPLNYAPQVPLSTACVVQDFLDLLELPLNFYARADLVKVWESDYLADSLTKLTTRENRSFAKGSINQMLVAASYIDACEDSIDVLINQADYGLGKLYGEACQFGKSCENLKILLEDICSPDTLTNYFIKINKLWDDLKIAQCLIEVHGQKQQQSLDQKILAVDLSACQALDQLLPNAQKAALQVDDGTIVSKHRLLASFKHILSQVVWQKPGNDQSGVRICSLDQAAGLDLDYVFVAGLNTRDFPKKPQARHLLNSNDLVTLGKKAGLPVWRTEEEEYSGQILNLLRIIAKTKKRVVLSCSSADMNGREKEPALELLEISRLSGLPIPEPLGGVFGGLPDLEKTFDQSSLFATLSQNLLGKEIKAEQNILAKNVLRKVFEKKPELKENWLDLSTLVKVEKQRHELDKLDLEQKKQHACEFCGQIKKLESLSVLGKTLDDPGQMSQSASSLEQYRACPLAWFFLKVLGLGEAWLPSLDLDAGQEGQWVHETLKLFFAPDEFNPNWTKAQKKERLEKCLAQALTLETIKARKGHSLLAEARKKVILQSLEKVVDLECEDMTQATPFAVEMDFGRKSKPFTLSMPPFSDMHLVGRVDRIDFGPKCIKVVDYKHTKNDSSMKNALNKENWGLTAFQLPLYLAFVKRYYAKKDQELTARLTPTKKFLDNAGIRAPQTLSNDDCFLAENFQTQESCQEQTNLFFEIFQIWQDMHKGSFTASPEKQTCSYCDFKLICRAKAQVKDNSDE